MSEPEIVDTAAAHVAGNVRLMRSRRGMSIGQLAARAGMSKGTLSKLETGTANPTLDTLAMLAGALAVPLHELFEARLAGIEVVRAGEGADLGDDHVGARLVHVLSRDRLLVEIHDLTLPEGHSEVSATHGEGSWEHVIVRSGRISAGPIDQQAELEEGDYAVYPGDRPHRWAGIGPGAARVWAVLTVAYHERNA